MTNDGLTYMFMHQLAPFLLHHVDYPGSSVVSFFASLLGVPKLEPMMVILMRAVRLCVRVCGCVCELLCVCVAVRV